MPLCAPGNHRNWLRALLTSDRSLSGILKRFVRRILLVLGWHLHLRYPHPTSDPHYPPISNHHPDLSPHHPILLSRLGLLLFYLIRGRATKT